MVLIVFCVALAPLHAQLVKDSPWPAEYAVTLHVSPEEAGADFAALQPALDRARQVAAEGQSVRVLVGAGHYRGSFELIGTPGQAYAPVAIEAEEAGRAVISGSEIADGWEVGDSGYFEKKFPAGKRVAAVYVQGVRVERTRADRSLRPGQFRLVGDEVQLIPPGGATVADGLVEVAYELPGMLLCIQNMDTVLVSGLYLRQGGGEGLRVQACGAVAVEHSTSEHQFIKGYHFEDLKRLMLLNVDALRNGQEGIKAVNIPVMDVVGGAASNNGYRVGEGELLAGEAFGVETQSVKKLTIRNLQAADNQGTGLGAFYADEVTMRSGKLLNNRLGLSLYGVEKATLREMIVAANDAGGMLVMGSACTASWSIFTGNGDGAADEGGAQITATDRATLSLTRCIVSATDEQVPLLAVENPATVGALSGNLYWGSVRPFQLGAVIPDKRGALPPGLDFAAWQAVTGQDLNSAWGDPMFNAPKYFEYIPLSDSIWYQQKKWPARTVTEAEMAAAREQYLTPADSSSPAIDPFQAQPVPPSAD
ncbi:MAG: right-handed parallel beta-helix repeat-containing protein [Verrucomicrobiota bacterium JB024]|nr:right-handed parallel beta-helix repeat-containing protein [Verrucomicrobiota bacterium JB024]